MFKRIFLTAALWAVAGAVVAQGDWEEVRGDHFIVYHKGGADLAREVLRKAEACYENVARDLGYARHSNFWSWDKRVKIWIYPTKREYSAVSGQPAWSVGNARYETKEILSYAGSTGFVTQTLPHEIAHLVFRDYVGFAGEVPLWLDEGVAQWQEPEKRKTVDLYVLNLAQRRQLWPLKLLTQADMGYLSGDAAARAFYIEAAALVSFMIRQYGADSFIHFCRQLRDGKSLDEALRFSYGVQLRSLDDLEAAFMKYIGGLERRDS